MLDNQIDSTTATVKLKAVFTNANYDLWPGQFVNVRLLLGTRNDAVTVPAQGDPAGSQRIVRLRDWTRRQRRRCAR